MKEQYIEAEVEVTVFEAEDVITESVNGYETPMYPV